MDDEMNPLVGNGGHRNQEPATVSFRPRVLYCAIYVWSSLTVGKFTAPLLQQLSPRFTDGVVGMTFAFQYSIVASLAGWGGSLADAHERSSSSWGQGRSKVVTFGLGLGTVAFLGHGLPDCMDKAFHARNSTMILWWHISMRVIYAVGMGISMPSLDGLCLAHLDCIEGASSADFGKERMFGAIFWGVGSLTAGVGIDLFGYGFLYAFLVISLLLSYASIALYLWGLRRDTTGAFESIEADDSTRNISSEYQHEETEQSDENDILSNRELLWMVFRTGYGQCLLFFVFALSAGIAVVDNLAFIFFNDALGASSTMDGWTVVFTVLFEIPVFWVAPMLLARWGPGRLLLSAGLAYVIRVVGYTLVPEGRGGMLIILALETLHGLTYAGSKTGSVEFISRMIPEGYEASGQGILMLISYMGIVGGLAVAGYIQETLGARSMFRVMATIVSAGMIVLLLAECFRGGDNQYSAKEKNATAESEESHLMKSESCASSASAFADESTERFVRSLKYDSLGQKKWVKDW